MILNWNQNLKPVQIDKYQTFVSFLLNMNLLLPENIFTSVIALTLPENIRQNLKFHPASSLSASLEKDKTAAALIPALDVVSHRDLFISRKYGISFEGSLCNTYIYFAEDRSLNSLNVAGDVSSSEVILSRLLFKELYKSDIQVALSASLKRDINNIVVSGKQNFYEDRLFEGISFSEEMIELLSLPYVNFVLASADEKLVKELEPLLLEKTGDVYEMFDNLEQYFSFSEKMLNYIKQNISSLVLEFDEQDIEAFTQLIMLPYYHGMTKDIIEAKFAGAAG